MEDWMPPSSSPPTLLSSMLGDEVNSRSVSDPLCKGESGFSFHNSGQHFTSEDPDHSDGPQAYRATNQADKLSTTPEQKIISRGGLLERMANRAGFTAPRLSTENIRYMDQSQNADVQSPYLTIPPGLSPTTLLDSPVFLSNSLAQPSPTTGKYLFAPTANNQGSALLPTAFPDSKENYLGNMNNSSFAFRPVPEARSNSFSDSSEVDPRNLRQPTFQSSEVSVQPENALPPQSSEYSKSTTLNQQLYLSRLSAQKDTGDGNMSKQKTNCTVNAGVVQSLPLDERKKDEGDQQGSGDPITGGAPAEDGYNWRKYGQKQVKGSEYPRSYYKCTHLNCPAKKKVERSQEGLITEIVYKGAHDHPKFPPNDRSALGDMHLDNSKQDGRGFDSNAVWNRPSDWSLGDLEAASTVTMAPIYGNGATSLQVQTGGQLESGGVVDGSSTFSSYDEDDDRGTHGSVSLECDGEEDESESKRRKLETCATGMSGATRAPIREPRVVVQTTSDVDILDDGYRWRKYGQKVVKGNPNPRSYYKCTSAGCSVRKHVERASHDLKSVITTYEGKHNHDVPAARNSSNNNSGFYSNIPSQAASPFQSHVQRPEPSELHNNMALFERAPQLSSLALPLRPPLGPSYGFRFGANQRGLPNMTIGGFVPGQGNLPILPVNQYLGQQRVTNDMGLMLPKGEPKIEPTSEDCLTNPNGSSGYHQLMSRMPLGPQM